jgi:hypothetical protein
MDDDGMDISDVTSATELYDMDQADEARYDAEDDARHAAELQADDER